MSYQEHEIPMEDLERHIGVLDSDEGIRIETDEGKIFINRTSRRYCINTQVGSRDEFLYIADSEKVLQFLIRKIGPSAKIYAY